MEVILAEKDKIIPEEKELSRIFNDHFINNLERSCGTKPTNLAKEEEIQDNKKAIEVICESFANYESIKAVKKITEKNLTAANSHLSKVSARDVEVHRYR